MPYVQNTSGAYTFTTTAITVNTRNKREFVDLGITEAKFKYTAWRTDGSQLGPVEVSVTPGSGPGVKLLPSHVQNLAELTGGQNPYWNQEYAAHCTEAGNAAGLPRRSIVQSRLRRHHPHVRTGRGRCGGTQD